MQRRLRGGEWDGVPIPEVLWGRSSPRGSVRGSREQVESAGRSRYLSDRLGHCQQRGRFLLGPAPMKPQGRVWMGTTGSMLRWWPRLVIGNGDREVGSGNFLPCVQLCRVGVGGWVAGDLGGRDWDSAGLVSGWGGGILPARLGESVWGTASVPGTPSLISEADWSVKQHLPGDRELD